MEQTKDRDPLAGEIPEMLDEYGVETAIGRTLRQGDAKLMLKRMAEREGEVLEQQRQAQEISDRIAHLNAVHEWNMRYLIGFGVSAVERYQFQAILREVAEHGGLTLREAANLAHARTIS